MRYVFLFVLIISTIVARAEYFKGSSVISNNNLRFELNIDSLEANLSSILIEDTLTIVIQHMSDSIQNILSNMTQVEKFSSSLLNRIDTLKMELEHFKYIADTLLTNYNKLVPVNRELKIQIQNLQVQIGEQDSLLTRQTQLLLQKELILKDKEDLYKEALLGSKIDLVKLEGEINTKEKELQGKSREIDLMSQSIQEKQRDIERKNVEINQIAQRREMANKMIDSLRDSLTISIQRNIVFAQEQKHLQSEIVNLKEKLAARDKKNKQFAVVQGVAMRSYRTPLYILAPKDVDNLDRYEIANENTGNIEFDLVTGASVRIFKLSGEDSKYNSDFGWFIGFGGKNLFKNFYFGPNVKVFDFLHLNAGLNVAEFRVLKSGFSEGDILAIGTPIPTVNQWKFNFYFTLSFDFELITQVAGKL